MWSARSGQKANPDIRCFFVTACGAAVESFQTILTTWRQVEILNRQFLPLQQTIIELCRALQPLVDRVPPK